MAARSPSITRALTAALREAKLGKQDTAAVALAKRLAMLIDRAEQVAEDLDAVRVDPDDETMIELIRRVRAKVDAQAVASDLGPKLLAVLAALGLTPAARSAVAKGGGTGESRRDPAAVALAQLRADRAAARGTG